MKPGTTVWGFGHGNPRTIDHWFGAYEDRAECIREATESRSDNTKPVWIQEGRALDPMAYMPTAETILEWANECNGEVSLDDDPFEATDEAMAELSGMIRAWASRHLDDVSGWIGVGEPECVDPLPVAIPESGEETGE